MFYTDYYYTGLCTGSSTNKAIGDFFRRTPYRKAMGTLQSSYFSLIFLIKNDIGLCFSIVLLQDYVFEAFCANRVLYEMSYLLPILQNALKQLLGEMFTDMFYQYLEEFSRALYFFCRLFVNSKLSVIVTSNLRIAFSMSFCKQKTMHRIVYDRS